LADFLLVYNFVCMFKTLGTLKPYEYNCKISTSEPNRFTRVSIYKTPGMNASAGKQEAPALIARCSIPDDHIDPRRSALFMARSILREVRDGVRTC
jgi:hypothetical protein